MIDPGTNHNHQLFLITSAVLAAFMIFPQVGISEGTPTPKKLRPASLRMKPATFKDNDTITGEIAFLKILLKIIRLSEKPKALHTSTYVSCFKDMNSLRTIRNVVIQPITENTKIRLNTPCPKILESKRMTIIFGNVKNNSARRTRRASIFPPKYPAIPPSTVPITAPQIAPYIPT
ncbi:Uncharacterised protein [Streptococcus pneumoniae]|nr:Uncharacterised protein [Streptococcus pneumoniae]VJK86263.1 Uncharacterised protein [Streptococcus pneumoniae]